MQKIVFTYLSITFLYYNNNNQFKYEIYKYEKSINIYDKFYIYSSQYEKLNEILRHKWMNSIICERVFAHKNQA